MNRSSLSLGHTSGVQIKALLMYLDAERGRAVADAWLKSIGMVRRDLEDETRTQPLPTLHRALKEFVVLTSREAIVRTWRYLVAPDNLGTWMRVLRGTTNPAEAFRRLDAGDAEYGRTTTWETLASGRGVWRGRVHITHDAALEADGLLTLARMTELRVVPALFGFDRPKVVAIDAPPEGADRGTITQAFEVTWRVARMRRSAAVGAVVGAAVGSVPLALHASPLAAGLTGTALVLGGAVGLLFARDRARRAETSAHTTRVRALERSLMLREARDAQAIGLEGSVVAGQYRIGQRTGSGASGVIYQAVRVSDGQKVAIKLLRTVAAHDAVATDRLRREAEALRLSWHPNVVEVLDHGLLADGTAFLVMELLLGDSLATRIQSRGRLAPAEVSSIALQVCDALTAVHAAGVVHRDLKPSNLILARAPAAPGGEAAPERVKIIDFGIARVEWEETRITNTGVPLGTPGYMAPEQETGGMVDARSDIFALGACIYEALVGEPPAPVPSGLWVASPPPPADATRPGAPSATPAARPEGVARKPSAYIPEAWQAVLDRAMAPLPRDRFPDARAFAHALRELEAGPGGQEAESSG